MVNPWIVINDRHDWFSLDTLVAEVCRPASGAAIKDYHIELRARADMRFSLSPSLDRITFSEKPEWKTPEGFLNPGQRYYWHVRARDKRGAWSKWSKTWSFVVK